MHAIQSIHPSDLQIHEARGLFEQYGDFLRITQPVGSFDFDRFAQEIATLPAFYTDRGGELLIAQVEGHAIACIAYRTASDDPAACEIKRLFVLPGYRGQGVSRRLVAATIERAIVRGYTRAILDTDTANMPQALALYQSFGFHEYAPRQGALAFLHRPLP